MWRLWNVPGTDETTAPVLDPGRGRTKTGYLWSPRATIGAGAVTIHPA